MDDKELFIDVDGKKVQLVTSKTNGKIPIYPEVDNKDFIKAEEPNQQRMPRKINKKDFEGKRVKERRPITPKNIRTFGKGGMVCKMAKRGKGKAYGKNS